MKLSGVINTEKFFCGSHAENSQLYLIYLLVFSLCLPVFVSLDFETGIHFDAFIDSPYSQPSIPISIFVFIILCLFKFRVIYFAIQKNILLVVVLTMYMALDLYWGINRGVIVGAGALLLLFSYYIFRDLLYGSKALHILFNVLCAIIFVKFVCDVYLQFYHVFWSYRYFYYAQEFQPDYFSTVFFCVEEIKIYTYHSYFPFIYYLAILLSIYWISKKEEYVRPALIIIISYLSILNTTSRLFEYGLYLIPLISLVTQYFKLPKNIYFVSLCVVGIAVVGCLSVTMWNIEDISLNTRNVHIYNFFKNLDMMNFFLPFLNEYRQVTHSSLHNEFIEMLSLCSFGAVLFYYFLYKIYMNTDERYEFIANQLVFILVIGSLIQLNLTNSYLSIIGMTFAALHGDSKQRSLSDING